MTKWLDPGRLRFVRVGPGNNSPVLTEGKWYEVTAVDHISRFFRIYDDADNQGGWQWERFDQIDVAGIIEPHLYYLPPRGEQAASRPAKKQPELPAECWRDAYGLDRKGVDFMAAVRATAEATKRDNK